MKSILFSLLIATTAALPARAVNCEKADNPASAITIATTTAFPVVDLDPDVKLLAIYTAVESQNRLSGLASYYSDSLDGTLTANGERYHKRKFTAAHLTLPLGTIIEVTSTATGKRVRLRVNDRGPYVRKFCLDLSHAAARALGVDKADDRSVMIRIVSLPGEPPLPDEVLRGPIGVASEEAGW
ncbi:MAG TPA: septal ring lytic transglycosylase RlpA family protein [Thermoanaerobaculia bacterium]|nr:septal ring lytic transglycosylase RlpA family protein [Thermoanaerobaculia bacterium]